jgi:hypothetical protein
MRLSDEQVRDRAGRWEALEGSLDLIGLLPAGPLRVPLTGFTSEAEMPERYPEGVSERKIGLFAVACCRRIWPSFRDPRCRQAVEVAERYLEGKATPEEMKAAHEAVRPLATGYDDDGPACAATALTEAPWGIAGAQEVAEAAAWYAPDVDTAFGEEMCAQAALLREVFGNPYREVRFDAAWRSAEVKKLAEEVYQSQEFGRLPELAELLGRAGCDEPEVLGHCRRGGGHVRGCWVIDLVLDRG